MTLQPASGFIFLEPIDHIPSVKQETGFGAKAAEKDKPEQSYKFRVFAVGTSMPFHGVWVPPEVKPGDIVSLTQKNSTLREQQETTGLLIGDKRYLVVDFRDVLGIWRTDETTVANASADVIHDAMASF